MGYSYSASLNTFFHTSVPDPDVPGDALDITDEQHEALMVLVMKQGRQLVAGEDGQPTTVEYELPGSS